MRTHTLKTTPESFAALASGIQTYDVKSREVRVGDIIVYEEWLSSSKKSGRRLGRTVTWVTTHHTGKKRTVENTLWGFQLKPATSDQVRLMDLKTKKATPVAKKASVKSAKSVEVSAAA